VRFVCVRVDSRRHQNGKLRVRVEGGRRRGEGVGEILFGGLNFGVHYGPSPGQNQIRRRLKGQFKKRGKTSYSCQIRSDTKRGFYGTS
jgi:hypothetical protein